MSAAARRRVAVVGAGIAGLACAHALARGGADAGVSVQSAGTVRHVVLRGGRLHRINLSGLRDLLRFGGLPRWTQLRLLGRALARAPGALERAA